VARVVEGVEPDEVGVEQRAEEVLADGDVAEHVGGGERRVEEEPHATARAPAPEERGEKPQVVVVDHDEVAVVRGERFGHAVREPLVSRDEGPVRFVVEAEIFSRRDGDQVAEVRPQVPLAEPVVELGVAVAVEVHGEAGECRRQILVDLVGGGYSGGDGGGKGADEGDCRRGPRESWSGSATGSREKANPNGESGSGVARRGSRWDATMRRAGGLSAPGTAGAMEGLPRSEEFDEPCMERREQWGWRWMCGVRGRWVGWGGGRFISGRSGRWAYLATSEYYASRPSSLKEFPWMA
jgi:hypothetical protein